MPVHHVPPGGKGEQAQAGDGLPALLLDALPQQLQGVAGNEKGLSLIHI